MYKYTGAIVSGKNSQRDCDSIFWQLDSAIDLSSGLYALVSGLT